ncbi:DUF3011 domain-containing protein [Candidatus Venteria ishoeyi]|uniref:DUF3011 domain-containing protein n=1 Tax=Candidatus Venteria ishoeyi TaxID=1899563 RepID=A0A1H6FEA6_9GAMM|nr:DUF3011 domain-containing protein [Candidatus Venteria ishoeyi]MDM8546818.1 DUF3011 domain-containing protein [Candidatus Venteria ishoeyi]SEH08408.1 Uncharacterised protein [Candidatus Venteria ishoeyi]
MKLFYTSQIAGRIPGILLLLFAGLSFQVQAAITGHVQRCESTQNDRVYCIAYVKGSVTLQRQLGTQDCIYQDSWGYDKGGIWVDRGCRAEFFVRETQTIDEVLTEPEDDVSELMTMTILADDLKSKQPNYSKEVGKNLHVGVDYNEVQANPRPQAWNEPNRIPSILRFNF